MEENKLKMLLCLKELFTYYENKKVTGARRVWFLIYGPVFVETKCINLGSLEICTADFVVISNPKKPTLFGTIRCTDKPESLSLVFLLSIT